MSKNLWVQDTIFVCTSEYLLLSVLSIIYRSTLILYIIRWCVLRLWSPRLVTGVIRTFKIESTLSQLLVQARCQRSAVHPLEIWEHQLGICKMSKTCLLISPLKTMPQPTASPCCLCWTDVVVKISFSTRQNTVYINVTLRRFRITIVVVGKLKVLYNLG